jgi:hypothetical protein
VSSPRGRLQRRLPPRGAVAAVVAVAGRCCQERDSGRREMAVGTVVAFRKPWQGQTRSEWR